MAEDKGTTDDPQVTPEDDKAEEPQPEAREARYSQADLDRIAGKTREEERRKYERQKEESQRKAREQALKDQEDWKKLAEERTATITEKDQRISELETVEGERDSHKERVENLEKRLAGLIKPQLEAVPELFRPFVQEKTVEEQAEWLEKNAEKLTEAVGGANGAGSRPAGSRPTGRASTPQRAEADKEAREGQRQARVSAI